ncbi:uncharacterized protein SPAPADRAFT_49819 [Spathaspora passalidarum NRRL Y-27907]|uniref:Required for respiratory growth protein 9, mitochondrial n=1 Tax=Spathaspora passalidarum (strain NRRL Y-27907 / 11-Y1) TaxID=619300 RepID=G3AKD0_SPAPN|nr:uncharacterized protein SPAPADRAFT_49819 [Spathaspora passalidarum NRRL Y-27907]EGW32887.1 hypothetical protein SPAPADRAFT_49819 [Spathaspora passalidarum NRRL Y-27907]
MLRRALDQSRLLALMYIRVGRTDISKFEKIQFSFSRCIHNRPTKEDLVKDNNNNIHPESNQPKPNSSEVPKEMHETTKLSFEEYQKKILLNHKKHAEPTEWQKRELAIKKRYGEWKPTKRLSREEMVKVKELSEQFPHYKTADLANIFRVSPEAIRRILKSNWIPNDTDLDKLTARRERQRQEKMEVVQQRYNKKSLKGPKQDNKRKSHKKVISSNYNYIGRRF